MTMDTIYDRTFGDHGLSYVQQALHLATELPSAPTLDSEAQYEKDRQDELRRGAFDLGAHLTSQLAFLPGCRDGRMIKLLRTPLSMFDRHRATMDTVAFFQEGPCGSAQRHGGQAGQLTWPKCMDIHGLDIFLPDTIELPVYGISVVLRVGERDMYRTILAMMTKRPEQNAYSDELPMFVPVPTVQHFSVYLEPHGRQERAWTDHVFGCRLRGVMYSEIC